MVDCEPMPAAAFAGDPTDDRMHVDVDAGRRHRLA